MKANIAPGRMRSTMNGRFGLSLPVVACLAGLSLAACSPTPGAAGEGDADAAAPCASDGDRLPLTGLCASRAVNYLNIAEGPEIEVPEGCEWQVQETAVGPDVLLYRALKCGASVTAWPSSSGRP